MRLVQYTTVLVVSLLLILQTASSQNTRQNSASTDGSLTFTVKTVSNNLGYSPKHVLSIWIKDEQGNFVVSRKVMAATRKHDLVKWVASSANNVATAITGATLQSHQTHTITWDGRNASGQYVEDGIYQVWVEYTNQNSGSGQPAGPSMSVLFHKGPVAEHLIPDNLTYFQNMVLDWVPLGVGVDELKQSVNQFTVYPNPFQDATTIMITLDKPSQVQAEVMDSSGKRISFLVNESCNAGKYSFTWDGRDDRGKVAGNGIYLLHLSINGRSSTQKLILDR